MKRYNENKGITLIALVVTVVILLILAGISINISIGEKGILKHSIDAQKKTRIAKDLEELNLSTGNCYINVI